MYAVPNGFTVGPASGMIRAPLCPAKLVRISAKSRQTQRQADIHVAPGIMLRAQIPLLDPTHQATALVILTLVGAWL